MSTIINAVAQACFMIRDYSERSPVDRKDEHDERAQAWSNALGIIERDINSQFLPPQFHNTTVDRERSMEGRVIFKTYYSEDGARSSQNLFTVTVRSSFVVPCRVEVKGAARRYIGTVQEKFEFLMREPYVLPSRPDADIMDYQLDEFTHSYCTTLLEFSHDYDEAGCSKGSFSEVHNFSIDDIEQKSLRQIVKQCREFQDSHRVALTVATSDRRKLGKLYCFTVNSLDTTAFMDTSYKTRDILKRAALTHCGSHTFEVNRNGNDDESTMDGWTLVYVSA